MFFSGENESYAESKYPRSPRKQLAVLKPYSLSLGLNEVPTRAACLPPVSSAPSSSDKVALLQNMIDALHEQHRQEMENLREASDAATRELHEHYRIKMKQDGARWEEKCVVLQKEIDTLKRQQRLMSALTQPCASPSEDEHPPDIFALLGAALQTDSPDGGDLEILRAALSPGFSATVHHERFLTPLKAFSCTDRGTQAPELAEWPPSQEQLRKALLSLLNRRQDVAQLLKVHPSMKATGFTKEDRQLLAVLQKGGRVPQPGATIRMPPSVVQSSQRGFKGAKPRRSSSDHAR